MQAVLKNSKMILTDLVRFETESAKPNLEFIEYVKTYLTSYSIDSHLSFDETGERANLYAIIGPDVAGGVILNGHTDVVPVKGQKWDSDPFELTERHGRLYGRGAVDMKGFLACILAMVPKFQNVNLNKPIYISMCFDEEIGGFGAPILVEHLGVNNCQPSVAIVGEPTNMDIVDGHKGGVEMRTIFTGFEAHASDPRKGVNANQYAAKFVCYLYDLANEYKNNAAGSVFEPAYTSFNVGNINGGVARNIIAGTCVVDWEFRPTENSDPMEVLAKVKQFVEVELLPQMKQEHHAARIEFETQAIIPALDPKKSLDAVELVRRITGKNRTEQVSFGTDAGHFCAAGISTIVMGPGSIDQAHKPNEFIEISEIANCLEFLYQLRNHLAATE